MQKKIVIVGPSGVGKTSFKNVVFEGKDPYDLVSNPISPTRGIISSIYKWIDIQLGIFDTSGQELPDLLNEEIVHLSMFENAEVIIYMIDNQTWVSEHIRIIEDIKKIKEILEKQKINAELIMIFHKMDLIDSNDTGVLQSLKDEILMQLSIPTPIQILFTSLIPELLNTCFIAFSNIISKFSVESTRVKTILDNLVKKHSRTLVIVTDHSNKVIIQSLTDDFDFKLIHPIYRNVPLLSGTNKSQLLTASGTILLDTKYNVLNFTMDKIKNNSNFNAVLYFSETNNKEYLESLNLKLQSQLNSD